MADQLYCGICEKHAGDRPHHATIDGDGNVHICDECFDPAEHDISELQKRNKELAIVCEALVRYDKAHFFSSRERVAYWQRMIKLAKAAIGEADKV